MSFAPQTVFLKEQLNHVLNLAFQESFPALKARTFIPVNRSIPQAAETVSASLQKCSLRSSIWQLKDCRWQMIFHQGTKLP